MLLKTIALSLTLSMLTQSCNAADHIDTDPPTKMKQTTYTFPEESAPHEGTWLQWPHQYQHGVDYPDELDQIWVEMTKALQSTEKVHLIAYNETERLRITDLLLENDVPLTNIDFKIYKTDDVWIRDNGPIYVRDNKGKLVIQDWGFNGWGEKFDYERCNAIPALIAKDTNTEIVNLNDVMVNEGGAVELDPKGVLLATKSAIISQYPANSIRNQGMSQAQAEEIFSQYLGAKKFIWLEGGFSKEDITDMHIDGIAKFVSSDVMVTMSKKDLSEWGVSASDITTLYTATNIENKEYTKVALPLTSKNVTTPSGVNLYYKGSYINYYVANDKVLVPNYNDVNDKVANELIANLYPGRKVIGIDIRNLYAYGGMIHCVTQQQPKQ